MLLRGIPHLSGFKMAGRQQVFNKAESDVALPKVMCGMMQKGVIS